MKECCRIRGLNPRPSACQAEAHPTELAGPATDRLAKVCLGEPNERVGFQFNAHLYFVLCDACYNFNDEFYTL